ncbi:unnamed protein product [Danaus chrysippus]|uniref:(African queen) hypothetical protein n=1 Tax=Danaus chrysippus TaxID=151541 RepID=A0A8J2W6L4_9NEOP|nr:unnamed protein product [Danaus chrysippus]
MKEARNKKAGTVAQTTTAPLPRAAQIPEGERNAAGSLMAVASDPTASRGTRNKKRRQRRRRQARTDVNPDLPPPHLPPKQGPRLPQKSKPTATEQATAYAVPITEVIQILQEILAAVQEGRVKEVVPTILRALTRLLVR